MTAPLAVRGYSQLQRSTIRCEAQSGLVRSSAWGVLGFWDWLLAHVIQCNSRQPHLILILQTPGSFCHGAYPATRLSLSWLYASEHMGVQAFFFRCNNLPTGVFGISSMNTTCLGRLLWTVCKTELRPLS